jgi:hypothetical protein
MVENITAYLRKVKTNGLGHYEAPMLSSNILAVSLPQHRSPLKLTSVSLRQTNGFFGA